MPLSPKPETNEVQTAAAVASAAICSALEVCPLCKHEMEHGEMIYACQVCWQDCHTGCSDSWDGDQEDDESFAGMWLDVVCDECLDAGFVPPESCKPNEKTVPTEGGDK